MRDVLLTTAEIARLLEIPTGTVRRWAHEDYWAPHGSTRHRRWRFSEAQRSFDRRRGDSAPA